MTDSNQIFDLQKLIGKKKPTMIWSAMKLTSRMIKL